MPGKMLMNLSRQLRFLLLLVLVTYMNCGEPNVVIEIDNQSPPSFSFKGNGSIPFFMVYEVTSDMSKRTVLWDIRPNDGAHARVPLGPIKYGVVPEGFTQKVPAEGPPPALQEGIPYQAGGPPIEMPNGYLQFKIQNGKTVKL